MCGVTGHCYRECPHQQQQQQPRPGSGQAGFRRGGSRDEGVAALAFVGVGGLSASQRGLRKAGQGMPPATGQGVGDPTQRSNLEASGSAAVGVRPCGATGRGTPGLVGEGSSMSALSMDADGEDLLRPCGATGRGMPGLVGVGSSMSALSMDAGGEDLLPPLVDSVDQGSQEAVFLSCLGVGRRRYDPEDFMLEPGLFAELDAELGPFTLEGAAAADGSNAHLDNFCYRGGRSFLTESLAGECVFANPPFRLARSFIEHYLGEKTRAPCETSAVFILPHNRCVRGGDLHHLVAHMETVRVWEAGEQLFTLPGCLPVVEARRRLRACHFPVIALYDAPRISTQCFVVRGEVADEPLFVDSGVTQHMTGSRHLLFDLCDHQGTVALGDAHGLSVAGVGHMRLQRTAGFRSRWSEITLQNVLYVPELRFTLVSVPMLTEHGGTFTAKGAVASVTYGEATVMAADRANSGLYQLWSHGAMLASTVNEGLTVPADPLVLNAPASTGRLDAATRHRRMGHPGHHSLRKLPSVVNGVRLETAAVEELRTYGPCGPDVGEPGKRYGNSYALDGSTPGPWAHDDAQDFMPPEEAGAGESAGYPAGGDPGDAEAEELEAAGGLQESGSAAEGGGVPPNHPPDGSRRSARLRAATDRFGTWQAHAAQAGMVPHRDPATPEEAMASPQRVFWWGAMAEEIEALAANGTWELGYAPPGAKVLPCKWVFKTKLRPDGSIERFKARLVAGGHRQLPGIDVGDVYAPVGRHASLRALLAVTAYKDLELGSVDISNAFLNGLLPHPVYMRQPPLFGSSEAGQVCILRKTLYGLKQAPRAWYDVLADGLREADLAVSTGDQALWLGSAAAGLKALHWVDDIIIAAAEKEAVGNLKSALLTKFKGRDLGEPEDYLNMKIARDRELLTLKVSLPRHEEELLAKLNMTAAAGRDVPITPGADTSRRRPEEPKCQDAALYMECVGALMYIAAVARPDLALAASLLAKSLSDPAERHMVLLRGVLKYLAGTRGYGIVYGLGSGLKGYADADYAGCEGHTQVPHWLRVPAAWGRHQLGVQAAERHCHLHGRERVHSSGGSSSGGGLAEGGVLRPRWAGAEGGASGALR